MTEEPQTREPDSEPDAEPGTEQDAEPARDPAAPHTPGPRQHRHARHDEGFYDFADSSRGTGS
ncbi:hypothetical protein [Streptomyces sp. NPDC046988]|uniref:hypothetical protein n=1 Tax=Streptomyces sp. NPDC046988 TaxID=3154922 RepID=UPI0033E9EFB5